MILANRILRWFRGFECAMCGWKSRQGNKINRHVKEFPNCAFTEQSYIYLNGVVQESGRQ